VDAARIETGAAFEDVSLAEIAQAKAEAEAKAKAEVDAKKGYEVKGESEGEQGVGGTEGKVQRKGKGKVQHRVTDAKKKD